MLSKRPTGRIFVFLSVSSEIRYHNCLRVIAGMARTRIVNSLNPIGLVPSSKEITGAEGHMKRQRQRKNDYEMEVDIGRPVYGSRNAQDPQLLTAMVQSVIKRFPNSLCPMWENPWQDRWV
jgi:hypothetical protein